MASKTKEAIVETFLDLLNDSEFDKISVTDVVEHCSISRQTFYYHFASIDEMIEWAFKTDFDKVLEQCKNSNNWMDALYSLIPVFEKYDMILRSARNSKRLIFIQKILSYRIYHFTADFYKSKPNFQQEIDENSIFLVKYTSSAIVGLLFMEMEFNPDFSYKKLFDHMVKTFSNSK